MKVNLSRIHSMLKNYGELAGAQHDEAVQPIYRSNGIFTIRIFEGTTDADIANFQKKVAEKKAQIVELLELTRNLTAYCAYLRGELDKGNSSSGVSEKLLELGNLQRKIANLLKIRSTMLQSCSGNLDPVRDANYYKTSFTDKQRTYDLGVKLFSDQDVKTIETEVETLRQQETSLKDSIALTNQTTMVDILSYEEFLAKK